MSVRVAFLRAVNVGKRTVRMPRLVELVGRLGYEDVWTHINSGNVVFDAVGRRADIERRLEATFEADLGFEVTTFVRTAAELRRTLTKEPFTVRDGDTYFVTFLKAPLSSGKRAALEGLSNDFDTLVVDGRDVHWRMRGKSTDTTISKAAWEAVTGRNGSTSRNTTSLRALAEKL